MSIKDCAEVIEKCSEQDGWRMTEEIGGTFKESSVSRKCFRGSVGWRFWICLYLIPLASAQSFRGRLYSNIDEREIGTEPGRAISL